MLSSKTLKEIVTEARPIIERQLDDAEQIAAFRDIVSGAGGDWGALKALLKAQIQDERDETGNGKRVKKILEKASFSTDYAELLGWSNMNENNFSAGEEFDPITGEILDDKPVEIDRAARARRRMSESMDDNIAFSAQMLADGLISEEAHAENVALSNAAARKFGNGPLEADSSDLPTNSPETVTEETAPDRVADVNSADSDPSGNIADEPRADANTGGDHEVGDPNIAAQAGVLVQSAPATNGVIYESAPKMPMKSLGFAHCFPELSKAAYQALVDDIAELGVLEPIIRMGDVIVNGWNRYNAARSLGMEYPVVEYCGDDLLTDVIKLQRSDRDWTPEQERKIADALAKVIPDRADDIWAAFHQAPSSGCEGVIAA